ncbi:trafficking regulator of GLUT4 1 [Eublepharis macularius]|uniref:Trafficking regulator of GLUT4 1 n=1 Tax=Eublepharis macularius TaxID=481883 RepID=A0AA97KGD2_EUBMA|nr:trafficking regulator of GLUT4 1 [Eublepharis macularius]
MAINTDAPLEKALEGSALPAEAHETEKLLAAGKVCKSFSSGDAALAGEAERNGHSLPYMSGSEGQLEAGPRSPSRLSLGRASSTATTSNLHEPERSEDYLLLAIFSCFCPVWPVNVLALVFSIMARNSNQQGDVDGAHRLGRVARYLSILSIVVGIIIILFCSLKIAAIMPLPCPPGQGRALAVANERLHRFCPHPFDGCNIR